MNLYCLEFRSPGEHAAERIWHTNRRALQRYAKMLENARVEVRFRSYEVPAPLTEGQLVAFLNAHCSRVVPPDLRDEEPGDQHRRSNAGS